jgi:maleylpyruvate isomerase
MTLLLEPIRYGHARLTDLTRDLTETQVRADSNLPGWSRGHVLIHLAELSRALTRQVRSALDGVLAEVYDGGRPARDATIEAGAGRPAADLIADVARTAADLDDAFSSVDDWTRRVTYRDGTLTDIALCCWREVEIHTADLGLGYTPKEWTPDFCEYLVDYLAPRAPDGVELTLVAGERRRVWGEGDPVEVRGELSDVAAWLAGRTSGEALAVAHGTLPTLAAWP